MKLKTAVFVVIAAVALVLGGCKDGLPDIPKGNSDVLGVVRDANSNGLAGLDVVLNGETVQSGKGGAFAFQDVKNGVYTLTVLQNGDVVSKVPVLLAENIDQLDVTVWDNVFENSGFEEHIGIPFPPAFPPSSKRVGWGASRSLDTKEGAIDVDVTVDNTVARTGSHSVKFYGRRAGDATPRATLRQYGKNLVPGATYRLTGYFKTDSKVVQFDEHPIYMRLRFYSIGSTAHADLIRFRGAVSAADHVLHPDEEHYEIAGGGVFLIVYPESYDQEWNELSVEFVLPEGSDRLLMEMTYGTIWHDGDEATLWWDDVTLRRIR